MDTVATTARQGDPARPRRVLIVSASMGAGHDGAARELARRLEHDGHTATIIDFLDMPPLRLGRFIRWTYQMQLRVAPWSYEWLYRLWYILPFLYGPVVAFDTFLTRRAFRREIAAFEPDVVATTYSLSALVLGRMRGKGWLRIPVATYLTDFAVHPLWVHPAIDLHLAVSPVAAAAAAARTASVVSAPGPLVTEPFRGVRPDRQRARRDLGIRPDAKVVLVVAGSWGVGEVVSTVTAIAASGRYHPVTVCGRDERLRESLEDRGLGTVIGWTKEMPSLMAAADVLVENAGGLTCMEAFAAGLPVVTFQPIPGHGRDNACAMAGAGVNRYARDLDELYAALDELSVDGPVRDELVTNGRALFAGDAADDVLHLADARSRPDRVKPFRMPIRRTIAAGAAATVIVGYGSLTLGAQAFAAFGVGIAHPPAAAGPRVFIGVRVSASDLGDPAVVREMANANFTAVVDAQTAQIATPGLRWLASHGVEIANGGWGHGKSLRWQRAQADVARASDVIHHRCRVPIVAFAPGRRFDAFDQIWSRRRRERLVRADVVIRPGHTPPKLDEAKVYLVDGRRTEPEDLRRALVDLEVRLRADGLIAVPLNQLR